MSLKLSKAQLREVAKAGSDLTGTAIRLAENGSRDAALDVLSEFCENVETGEQPDPRILQYLSRAFREVLADGKNAKSADEALRVTRPKHRLASKNTIETDLRLAREVIRRMRSKREPQAIADTATRHRVSESKVKAALNKYRTVARKIEGIPR